MRAEPIVNLDEEAPIIIAGSKRGGTTLLRRIINAHSNITIPPPDWIYHTLHPYLYSYGDLTKHTNIVELIQDILELPHIARYWKLPQSISDIVSLLPEWSFRGVIATLFRLYTQTPYWGSKVPNNCFWLKEIHRDFPKARFLLLYRDGRDASYELVQTQASGWPYNLYTACLWWKSYMHAMLESRKCLPSQQYHEVAYEELVTAPEMVVKRICTFLNLDYETPMLQYHQHQPEDFLNRAIHQRTHHPISTAYIGVHRTLPRHDLQLQIAVMGDLLKQLGYSTQESPRTVTIWEREWSLEEQRITSNHHRQYKQQFLARVKNRQGRIWTDRTRIQYLKNALSE